MDRPLLCCPRVAAQSRRRGNCRPERARRSTCRGSGPDRDFLCVLCEDFWRFWNRRPLKFLIKLEEERAVTPFKGHTLLFKTAEEDTAVWGVEGKEIGLAKQIAALFVFFLERFGILAKETQSLLLAGQALARYQQETLTLLVLVDGVAVPVPRRGQSLGARLIEKLLQHFFPAEFAQDVFVELGPIGA